MKLISPRIIKIKKKIIMTAVAAALILTAGLSGIIYAAPPEVEVTRPAAVINYDPENSAISSGTLNAGGDYLQKNMRLNWHKQAEKDEDLKIYLTEIRPVGSEDNDEQIQMGFTRLKNNNSIISRESILVKSGNSDYKSLDQKRTVLETGEDESELKFKLDAEKIGDWQNIPAGTYKAEIDGNYELKNNPRVQINVKEHLEIIIEDDKKLELEIEDPTLSGDPENIDQYNDSLSWRIDNNLGEVNVSFSSRGGEEYQDLTEIEAKDFFRYVIEAENSRESREFSPSQSETVNFASGQFKVLYSTDFSNDNNSVFSQEEQKEWHELTAGKYQDQIVITVEAE
ncbi:MAG: hypothetical protein ACOC1M_07180 [Halanaerobium sp.]